MLSKMKRILIVDRYIPSRHSFTALLGLYGFQVATAGDATEALLLSIEFKPDIVVCDWHLPHGETADHLTEQLGKFTGSVEIILVVDDATSLPDSAREFAILEKPFHAKLLLPTLLRSDSREQRGMYLSKKAV